MSPRIARIIGQIFGWIILMALAPTWAIIFSLLRGGYEASGTSGLSFALGMVKIMLNPPYLLTNVAAWLLIFRAPVGYLLLYVATLVSFITWGTRLFPFLDRLLPAGPEFDYYSVAVNLIIVTLLAWCHWTISREFESNLQKRIRISIFIFYLLLIPVLIFWKTGIRTGNGEVQTIAQIPSIGPHLGTLESTQPILYRSHEGVRSGSSIVIFRGMSSEKNIRQFAESNNLRQMTNDSARMGMIPQSRSWKLDPERFPVFTNATDLCYIGRIPTNSRAAFQLCFRPTDGRFTAMSMGNLLAPRAENSAAPKK